MDAHHVLAGSALDSVALKVVCQAFDAAWLEIASNYIGKPALMAQARVALAKAMLSSVAHEGSSDVEALKRGALQAMAQGYGTRCPD